MQEGGKSGGPAPYYQPAMREVAERVELAQVQKLLREAKAARDKFGNIDAAISDLESAVKRAR